MKGSPFFFCMSCGILVDTSANFFGLNFGTYIYICGLYIYTLCVRVHCAVCVRAYIYIYIDILVCMYLFLK